MGKVFKNNDKNQTRKNKKLIFPLFPLVLILIAINSWLLYFYIKNRGADSTVSKNDEYNLLNPVRKFVKQEDLIINFQPLRNYLNDKYETDKNVSIYFE